MSEEGEPKEFVQGSDAEEEEEEKPDENEALNKLGVL